MAKGMAHNRLSHRGLQRFAAAAANWLGPVDTLQTIRYSAVCTFRLEFAAVSAVAHFRDQP